MLIWRYASDASSRKLEELKCWHMVGRERRNGTRRVQGVGMELTKRVVEEVSESILRGWSMGIEGFFVK